MIGYRDMEFCIAACSNATCPRKLTDKIVAEAEAWWGEPGAPIIMANRKDHCDDFTPEGEING